jgi:hypothetical protein
MSRCSWSCPCRMPWCMPHRRRPDRWCTPSCNCRNANDRWSCRPRNRRRGYCCSGLVRGRTCRWRMRPMCRWGSRRESSRACKPARRTPRPGRSSRRTCPCRACCPTGNLPRREPACPARRTERRPGGSRPSRRRWSHRGRRRRCRERGRCQSRRPKGRCTPPCMRIGMRAMRRRKERSEGGWWRGCLSWP